MLKISPLSLGLRGLRLRLRGLRLATLQLRGFLTLLTLIQLVSVSLSTSTTSACRSVGSLCIITSNNHYILKLNKLSPSGRRRRLCRKACLSYPYRP